MYNIIKLNEISKLVNSILDNNYNISDDCDQPQAIILRSFNMHEYQVAPSVLAVARAGAGVNNIPLDKMSEKGICVFNTPGANANAVKELIVGALILGGRKIVEAINWTQALDPQSDVAKLVEKGKKAFIGQEILGKTLGVVGLGAIGRMVANAAIDLGMKVIGYDPFLNEQAAKQLNSNVKITDNLGDIYATSEYITLHVPATAETKNSINAKTIAQMKDGVVIINCARAELVNNADIIEAVNSGKVGRYITDLPCGELIGINNIITIPHLGASTPEAEDNCAVMAANQLKDYLENGNIKNSVNFPCVSANRSSSDRFSVIYGDVAIAELTSAFDKANIKVVAMNYATRNGVSYCLVDTDKKLDATQLQQIQAVKSVIKVNVF